MNFCLYTLSDVETFCGYKQFIENTIVELGDDWRIQSGLLSQEIVAILKQKNETEVAEDGERQENVELQFNIFNEFLLPFLKDKIGKEGRVSPQSENDIQDSFADALGLHFNRNPDIVDSLTFKTLSLGFCITAVDQWEANFNDHQADCINTVELTSLGILCKVDHSDNNKRIRSSFHSQPEQHELGHFHFSNSEQAKKESECFGMHVWKSGSISEFLDKNEIRSLKYGLKKTRKPSEKVFAISCFAVDLQEVNINGKAVKIMSINNGFYRISLIVWLIFNIKLFFTLGFGQFKHYFSQLVTFWQPSLELPLKKFFLIIDREWNLLLKDYSVALHDDLEVLKKLIERVRREYASMWAAKREEVKNQFAKKE